MRIRQSFIDIESLIDIENFIKKIFVQDFGKNGSGLLVTKVCEEEEEGWKKKVFLFQNMSFVGSKPVWTINEWMSECTCNHGLPLQSIAHLTFKKIRKKILKRFLLVCFTV